MPPRARRTGSELPQLELECLAALWAMEQAPSEDRAGDLGAPSPVERQADGGAQPRRAPRQSTVAAVHQHLAGQGRPLAYTTVLTVLDRLRRKQVVTRERQGRAFLYRPLVSREEMRARALDRLVRNYFASRAELEAWLRNGRTPPPPPQPAEAPAEAAKELAEPLFID